MVDGNILRTKLNNFRNDPNPPPQLMLFSFAKISMRRFRKWLYIEVPVFIWSAFLKDFYCLPVFHQPLLSFQLYYLCLLFVYQVKIDTVTNYDQGNIDVCIHREPVKLWSL